MSIFAANIRHRSFVWQISALCFVLGLLLAAAVHTAAQIARAGLTSTRTGFFYADAPGHEARKTAEEQAEIKKLRDRNTELENNLAENSGSSRTLNKELQETKVFAGLVEVTGPGVQVTLDDSKKQDLLPYTQLNLSKFIHDSDVSNVVNELKIAGAEAISVNGQRIVSSTAIRCVGPVIQVNEVPAATPIVIQAIGNPDTMASALNMSKGVLDDLRRFDPDMVRVEKKRSLRIPAFTGGTQIHFAHPAESGGSEQKVARKERSE